MKIAPTIFFFLLFSCAHQNPARTTDSKQASAVNVEIKTEYLEKTYSTQQNECRVSVTTHLPESPNKDVARLRHYNCDETLIEKFLERILFSMASNNNGVLPFDSLSMGRLVEYPEFSKQLMTFASHSKHWDAKKGRAKKGHPNNFSTDALNQLLPSMWIVKILHPYWKNIKIPGVEKVLVDPVSKLPFDCQFWLSSK